MKIKIAGQHWSLLPEKAVWLEHSGTMLISDLHLGKVEHFRKNGIAVPAAAAHKTLQNARNLMQQFQPEVLLILGDLFHSSINRSFEEMQRFREENSACKIILIEGNHDILDKTFYRQLDIEVLSELFLEGCQFTHQPTDVTEGEHINVCGHVHPAVKIKGKGRQALTLPCFFRKKTQFILPAFGYFTGKSLVEKTENTSIFAIAGQEIIQV